MQGNLILLAFFIILLIAGTRFLSTHEGGADEQTPGAEGGTSGEMNADDIDVILEYREKYSKEDFVALGLKEMKLPANMPEFKRFFFKHLWGKYYDVPASELRKLLTSGLSDKETKELTKEVAKAWWDGGDPNPKDLKELSFPHEWHEAKYRFSRPQVKKWFAEQSHRLRPSHTKEELKEYIEESFDKIYDSGWSEVMDIYDMDEQVYQKRFSSGQKVESDSVSHEGYVRSMLKKR